MHFFFFFVMNHPQSVLPAAFIYLILICFLIQANVYYKMKILLERNFQPPSGSISLTFHNVR